MWWVVLILGAAVFYSLSTFCDDFLVDKYFKGVPPRALVFFSVPGSLLVMLVLIIWRGPEELIFRTPVGDIFFLLGSGILDTIGVIPYLKALKIEDATDVNILMQLGPLIALAFGAIFLREQLNFNQLIAFGMMFVASLLIVANFTGNKVRFRWPAVKLILLASIFWNLSYVVFVQASGTSSFWTSLFWLQAGVVVLGTLLFVVWKEPRKVFIGAMKKKALQKWSVNLLNEVFFIGGEIFYRQAFILAPFALVSVTESVAQLLVTFGLGVVLTLILPKFCQEDLSRAAIAKRVIATCLMIGGLVLIG